MTGEHIKRHELAYVATISRSDSGVFENVGAIENLNRMRPHVDSSLSNEDITRLVNLGTHTSLDPLPDQQTTVEKNVMTSRNPKKNLWRIIAVCVWSAAGGASDAAPGALLPHMERFYDISYSIVSLIWMANAAGFILVACFSSKIQPYMGKRYSLTLGCALSCIMYSFVSSGSKFPLIVSGFFFGGAGLAIVLAQSNIFLASLDKQSKYLSFFHGSYGIGATISPLIATSMVDNGIEWNYFYLIILGLMILNGVNLWMSFTGADEDLKPWDKDQIETLIDHSGPLEEGEFEMSNIEPKMTRRRRASKVSMSHKGEMALAIKNPITWLISFFCLFYQGSEVSVGGWIVTYLMDYRHADAGTVGYVASGFWGGLTIGRLLLTRILHLKLGARRSVIVLSTCCIILAVLIWVVPNVFAEGVFVAILGILIGPNYPLLITVGSKILPRKIQVVSLTIMTAFGSSGGAIFPFLVGLISQSAGTYVVMPIFIALYSTMLILWILLPNIERQERYQAGNLSFFESLW